MTSNGFSLTTLTSLTLCSLLGCELTNQPDPQACEPDSFRSEDVSAERAAVVEDNSAFAWDLYHQVREDDANLGTSHSMQGDSE